MKMPGGGRAGVSLIYFQYTGAVKGVVVYPTHNVGVAGET
jgi:hypothetical protein